MNKLYKKQLIKLLDEEWNRTKGDEAELPPEISQGMKHRLFQELTSRKTQRKSLLVRLQVAASLVGIFVLAGLAFYFINDYRIQDNAVVAKVKMIEKVARAGTQMRITLPDKSTVVLNNASTIRYPESFDGDTRQVYLDGEAFFNVEKNPNRPFVVQSQTVYTQVLGTSFNVCAYPNESIEVTVATGLVKVSASDLGNFKEVELTPSDQAVFSMNTKELLKQKVDISDFLAWKDGVLQFNKISLEEAAKKIERWYDVKITFQNDELRNYVIKGSYRNEKLINVLRSFKFIQTLDFKMVEENEFVIYTK